jgi:hypothetical protein
VKRQWLATGMTIVALSSVLSACGSSDDAPKASPTKTSSATPATTSAPAPAPAVTAQPPGANGVTLKIQDWEKHQADPAVLAWTHALEDLGASINRGALVPGLDQRTSKSVLRIFVNAINVSKDNAYHVPTEGDVKVLSSKTTGDRAELTMCMWSTTTGVRDKNDNAVGDDEDVWFKQKATLSTTSGQWVLKTLDDSVGNCTGGPPV